MRVTFTLALVAMLGACHGNESTIHYTGLHHMVRSQSESAVLDLAAPGAINMASEWIVNDVPSAAVVTCTVNSPICGEAVAMLKAYRVPFTIESITGSSDRMTFVYDRISQKPCDKRYYGCPQALNSLRMVDDLRRVVRPSPLDYPSASRFVF